MKPKFVLFILPIAFVLGLGFIGCSDDDDNTNPAGPSDEDTVSYSEYQIDATDAEAFVYYSLATDQEVTVSDPESSTDWSVGFKRYQLKLNGGSSGTSGMKAVDLESLGNEYGTDFEGLVEIPQVADDEWVEDATSYVFDGWYTYDPTNHTVDPSNRVFALRGADGESYAKLIVTGITPAGMMQIGAVELTYVYDAEGGDLSGDPVVVTVEDTNSDNSIFFSFATGAGVEIDDPAASTDWDIWFDGFTVKINGGISGLGASGVYPAYDDDNYNDFDTMTSAPPDMGGSYEQDSVSSVFDDWYEYNSSTHELLSTEHVYLILTGDAVYYKFQITNYYKVVDGSPVSAWIAFRYKEL